MLKRILSLHAIGVLASMGYFTLNSLPALGDEYNNDTIQQCVRELQANAELAISQVQNTSSKNAQMLQPPSQPVFSMFPIQSISLSPGMVQPMAMKLDKLAQPIFLIGSDELSKEWLQKNHDQLKQINAIGFLVNAQTEEDYQAIIQLADDINIVPSNGDAFAKQWNLQYYPVLIDNEGVSQ